MAPKLFGNVVGAPKWNISEKHRQLAESTIRANPEWGVEVMAAYLANILVEKDAKSNE